ncbi:hypothetical protein [Pandoraea apista]|uniref:hypothetical protein n=1 Tax=Pandoraea apista TaxID=93218 RepID=UPI00065A0CCA|nr:hypothetical protein [Pandoraea apista]ALS63614.1 hypothetical protein AT395_00140 [Pandoraea apista]CFB63143.1 hypothetical protein LMG16407_03218 [Pandoraea apista]
MTDEEALLILAARGGGEWINWNERTNRPQWWQMGNHQASITLDGDFTREQLMAILHFEDRAE